MDKKPFVQTWQAIGNTKEMTTVVTSADSFSELEPDNVKEALDEHNVFHIATRSPDGTTTMYFSLKTCTGNDVLVEAGFPPGQGCKISLRSKQPPLLPFAMTAIKNLIQQ